MAAPPKEDGREKNKGRKKDQLLEGGKATGRQKNNQNGSAGRPHRTQKLKKKHIAAYKKQHIRSKIRKKGSTPKEGGAALKLRKKLHSKHRGT